MLPERYQGVPCASVRANSSKMRRCAAQPSHLSSSLHPAPPRKPKASPPVIAEWHQPLSAAACSLTRLLLHTKPALAAVLRVVSSAFHAQRCHCTEPCRSPRLGPLITLGDRNHQLVGLTRQGASSAAHPWPSSSARQPTIHARTCANRASVKGRLVGL